MQEQRRHFRKQVDWAIEFSSKGGKRTPGICRDLSLGGMQIDTDAPAEFAAEVLVYVTFKGRPESKLPGTVRWTKERSMGVQFGLIGAHETYALTQMLSEP